MEQSSTATLVERWKLCTFWSFLGCLMLILFINQNHRIVNFSAARSAIVFPASRSCPKGNDQFFNHSSSPPTSSPDSPPIIQKTSNNLSTTSSASKHKLIDGSSSNSTQPSPAAQPIEIILEKPAADHQGNNINATDQHKKFCNIFDGRWVYKADGMPHYNTTTCSFIEEKMSCRRNGRPDYYYEKWSWQPTDCDIPAFNGTDMLERLRGKRMILVGDSLNRNQWESLACLLYTSIPPSGAYVDSKSAIYKVFKAKDYNCTVEFYWSPFIVDHDEKHKSGKNVLVLDKLPSSSDQWKGADIMVFNTGHWWIHLGKFKSWDTFEYKNQLIEEMQIELAYERGLTTWVDWIKQNVDTKKTRVFFRSISSEHQGNNWCYNSTVPIMDDLSYHQRYPHSMIDVVEKKIKEIETQVGYLNVTKMSKFRIDAHPSIYRTSDKWKTMTTMSEIKGYADCSHWCLPGVPDTWNRLLYVSLFFDTSTKFSAGL